MASNLRRRQLVTNSALVVALLGLGMAVIDQELSFRNYSDPGSHNSVAVSLLISLSSALLCVLVLLYHYYRVSQDESSFISCVTLRDVYTAVLEVLLCSVHPSFLLQRKFPIHAMLSFPDTTVAHFHVNSLLTICMFARLYLIFRAITLNSPYSTQPDSAFVFKSLLHRHPIAVLLLLIASGFLISSWSLRACEISVDEIHGSFANSMWLIAITYMSVGYGDIVPISICGRMTAVFTGIFGAFCTALLIAVVIPNLRFTRAERNLFDRFLKSEHSASIERECSKISHATTLIYQHSKDLHEEYSLASHSRLVLEQRNFNNAKRRLRAIRLRQSKMAEESYSLSDIGRLKEDVKLLSREINKQGKSHEAAFRRIMERLDQMD